MQKGIYTGLSGLQAFSSGLDNISSNVANMNTPGYKRQQLQFRDTYYRSFEGSIGTYGCSGPGVTIAGANTNFAQGELQATGKSTDMALTGEGYFLLEKDGQYFLTRAGQFDFDAEGYLTENASGMRVMAWDGAEAQAISITDYKVIKYTPTSKITFVESLSKSDQRHELTDITVYDSNGNKHVLSMVFTKNTLVPGAWLVDVKDENGVIIKSGEIRFDTDGSPLKDFNTLSVTHSYADVGDLDISLDFGTPGGFDGANNWDVGINSSLKVDELDGYATGFLSELKVDEEGNLVATYSNAEETKIAQIAVAQVQDQDALRPMGGTLFDPGRQELSIGAPGKDGNGEVAGGQIELSNVELTNEFTEMIVIQRGYQAVSQVITAANEMLQQLVEMTKTR